LKTKQSKNKKFEAKQKTRYIGGFFYSLKMDEQSLLIQHQSHGKH